MDDTRKYLNEVRDRAGRVGSLSLRETRIIGFDDVPKLLAMLEIAIEDIESECYCTPQGGCGRVCERCRVLAEIGQITRGKK